MQTIEQYIKEKTEEFADQYFYDFYLDVIHRGYHIDQFLDEENKFEDEADDMASYDFLELKKILKLSSKECMSMEDTTMANYFRDDLRLAIKHEFVEKMEDKWCDLREDINDLKHEDKPSDREYNILKNRQDALVRAINLG